MADRNVPEVTEAHLEAAERVLSPLVSNEKGTLQRRIALAIAYAEQRGRRDAESAKAEAQPVWAEPAEAIAEDTLHELLRRGGFDAWWYDVDRDIRDEIREALVRVVRDHMKPPPPCAGAEQVTNCCEHGDHPAPEGKRFCSEACARCEHESQNEETGCDGICEPARALSSKRPATKARKAAK